MATLAGLSETGNAYSITITDTSVDAAALNTLDGKTTVAINASNITTLTGAAADLNTAYTANDNGSISGLSNEDVTLSDTTLDVSILNTLDGNTSGTIDASSITTLTGAAADLNTAYTANDNGSISGLSNEDVTLSDTTLDVSVLNTLDGNTSGTIDASSITTLNGVADDLITAYAANGSGISGLGNEAVNVDSGTATTDQANTLATATSAVVTATLSDGDMATLAGLSETGNAYSITITDTSVDAAALNTLDGKTTVAINASNITTLTGAAADLNTAYTANDNGSISGLSNEDVTLSDTTLDVSSLNTLDGNTSGTIDASSINTLTGAAEDLNTAYDSGGITGLDDEDVTLTDTTLDAAVLNTLDGNTAGTIDASSITTLTGSTTELTTAYASSSISGLGDEAVNVSSGTATTDQANTLAEATSGVVTATLSDGDLETLADLSEADNAYSIIITDESVNADELNALNEKTTTNINAENITEIAGAVNEIATTYTAGGINDLGDEEIIFTFENIDAASLNAIDAANSKVINASGVAALTGDAADVNTAFDSNGISGLVDQNITLTDTSLAANTLNTLDSNTTGTVNADTVNTLSGAAADLNTAYDSDGISNLGDEDITLSDASLAADTLNTLDSNTTGTVNADTVKHSLW